MYTNLGVIDMIKGLIFLIWDFLEAMAKILQKISVTFGAMDFQDFFSLRFPDL